MDPFEDHRLPPLPLPDADNTPFYDAARRGELRFQRCLSCKTFRHYPRPACPTCLSREFTWELSSGRGVVYTWTVVHGPTVPAFAHACPYNVVDVLMDEGVHFISQLVGRDNAEIRAGLPVRAVFVPASEQITLVKFVPATLDI